MTGIEKEEEKDNNPSIDGDADGADQRNRERMTSHTLACQ